MTVIPVLTVNNPYALNGNDLTLNASGSYVTVLSAPSKYENMDFVWLCPDSLDSLCEGETDSILDISFDDFLGGGGNFN
jgi:hypothetical protein